MFRRLVGPITGCLLLSWGVLAAPRKDDPPPVYHPSKVGDKLVYEDDYGDQPREWVVEVTEARHKGAAMFVTVRVLRGGFTSESRCQVSDKGVYKVAVGDAVLESPECCLRLPFQKGETWETPYTHERETVTVKVTSADEEEVEIPAGKFRCLRIEAESVDEGVTWTQTRWYAPRVGMVKDVLADKDNHSVFTTVLKSFAAGGK